MSVIEIIETSLPGVLIVVPRRYPDERGFLSEQFRDDRYAAAGIGPLVQDNLIRSRRGVIRGLHLQNPHPQGKLVMAIHGRILDVAVDVRRGSPCFGKAVAVELSDDNGRQLWLPRGFAHGFSVLSQEADVFYKCDDYYDPKAEITINHADPAIGIDWKVEQPILSPKDAKAPRLADIAGLPAYRT
jgi:dTDP-4-dehydrorhamnose 3,5-epimerase